MNLKDKIMNLKDTTIKLDSVGSVLNYCTLMVYPQFKNGTPDLDNGVQLIETSSEWMEKLSLEDYLLIDSILEKHINSMEKMQKENEK